MEGIENSLPLFEAAVKDFGPEIYFYYYDIAEVKRESGLPDLHECLVSVLSKGNNI